MRHDDQLLAQQQRESGKVAATLLATDQQHSVLNAPDATQPNALAYSPYGHRPRENGLLSLLGFNGERPDPVTGHYHLGNGYRQFNPVLMRFNSPDSWSPLGKGGLNAYAYCQGDPANMSDPSGHLKIPRILRPRTPPPSPPPIRPARAVITPGPLPQSAYDNVIPSYMDRTDPMIRRLYEEPARDYHYRFGRTMAGLESGDVGRTEHYANLRIREHGPTSYGQQPSTSGYAVSSLASGGAISQAAQPVPSAPPLSQFRNVQRPESPLPYSPRPDSPPPPYSPQRPDSPPPPYHSLEFGSIPSRGNDVRRK
ncbi:RHS repeat-associated core domain-containing protein [Pseudomonas fluorescens]|uniref:RHS repeat-associated core domain-containing protein n=1 Tax=Pseudomonas fluorescens TaxID=294 RepID=UPI003F7AC5DF